MHYYPCGWCCTPEILPTMPALCSMLFDAHYAPNYAGIIGSSLLLGKADLVISTSLTVVSGYNMVLECGFYV